MNDKSIGYSIMFIAVLFMVVYFVWSFAPWLGPMFSWLAPYSEWAFRVPILLAAYGVLFIVIWIGYTMATTPPPIPLENPLDLDEGEEKKESS